MILLIHTDFDPATASTHVTSVTHHPASRETFWRRAFRVVLHDITDGRCEVIAEEVHVSSVIAAWCVGRFAGVQIDARDLVEAEG